MRKNVFLKSTIRRPLRALLLSVLIGVAAFFLVSRVAEYLIVTQETERIGGYYRSIGYFDGQVELDSRFEVQFSNTERFIRDREFLTEGMRQGAEMVSQSPYFDYEVTVQRLFGVMEDTLHTDVEGRDHIGSLVGELYLDRDPADDAFHNIAYFYMDLKTKLGPLTHTNEFYWWPSSDYDYYLLDVQVGEVLLGFPEYIRPGQNLKLRWIVEEGVAEQYAQLESGGRYFVKAIRTLDGHDFNFLYLAPLNENGLWFVPLTPGEEVSFDDAALSHLPAEFEILYENQRTMLVVAANDMGAMPNTQEVSYEWFLTEGRWIDHDDHLNENKVAVLHRQFATMRGFSIGDEISLDLRSMVAADGQLIGWGEGIPFGYPDWQSLPSQRETYEIVGLFDRGRRIPTLSSDGRDVFVPTSTVPAEMLGPEVIFGPYFYSFVLSSSRHQDTFVLAYQDVLAGLGVELRFIEHEGERFWAMAEPIIASLSFNMLLYAAIYLLISILAVYFYLRQRRMDYAILRSLGRPSAQLWRQLLWPPILTWLPFMAVAALLAWYYAHDAAVATLAGLREMAEGVGLPLVWLVWIGAAVALVPLVALTIAALRMTRRPVLEVLQDTKGSVK